MRVKRLMAALILSLGVTSLLLWGLATRPTNAAGPPINVNKSTDATDINPGNGTCDDGTGNCTLRAAIQEANAAPGPDMIILPAATYSLTITGNNENVAASGDLDVTGALTITGAGEGVTLIDASMLSDRVFHIITGTAIISGVTIQGGNDTSSFLSGGGGIWNQSILTLINTTVVSNISLSGGGINNFDPFGEATTTVVMTNTVIVGNEALFDGGGVYSADNSRLALYDSTVSYNRAGQSGGGISVDNGVVKIIGSRINNNIAVASVGGIGIHGSAGVATLINTSVNSNTATAGSTGGIFNAGNMEIVNSTIGCNSADDGGGGGIMNDGTSTVNSSTFSDNSARYGGGIYNLSSAILHLQNSILANSLMGGDCYNRGVIAANLNNLVEDGSCSPTLSGDPKLSSLQDNGGPTLTYALLPGSPAINAGQNTTCLTVDQRGVARPQLGQCDIGAFESRGFTLAVGGGNNQVTAIGSPFSAPLEVIVTSHNGSEPVNDGLITFAAPDSGPSTTFAPTTNAMISGGIATLNVTANIIAGGPYNVVASTKGGNSVSFNLINTKVTPTVTVASAVNPSKFGQAVTFTATVSSGVGTPIGSVTFIIDGTPQSPVSLVNGQAVFSTSTLSVGDHSVSVDYSGDTNFNAGSGLLVGGQAVNAASIYLPIIVK
jgi:CSLREA domain-containing protein